MHAFYYYNRMHKIKNRILCTHIRNAAPSFQVLRDVDISKVCSLISHVVLKIYQSVVAVLRQHCVDAVIDICGGVFHAKVESVSAVGHL